MAAISIALLAALLSCRAADAQTDAQDALEQQPAEKVFHNIQVLKGMRAADLQAAMSFIASSLNVDCDYCHRGEDFGKDVTKEKSRAREMMRMVREINDNTFHGENKVNCFTCHQGHKDPVSLAPISPPAPRESMEAAAAGPPPGGALPSVDEVLDHYVQALGGRTPLDGVKSRVLKIGRLDGKNPETKTVVYQKAPGKALSVSESPDYRQWVGYDGERAWAQDSLKSYWGLLNTSQRNSIMRDSEMYAGCRIKSAYSNTKVKDKEKVGEEEAYVVTGTSPEGTSEEFYFDARTGLLLRRHILEQTVFGGFQIQEDFEDYREVGGVKIPFVMKWSSAGNAWGTKVSSKILEVQQNNTVEDEIFEGPPSATPQE
ncbi:MAG TPA: photosynthetic reaction center cytochrome c subunit family protein [Candidatus Methylomirabilis sp.]|nr:photosynthetic reaction center cytochrome c subunit family protein [Candidatus Methylomirabilis sp.]